MQFGDFAFMDIFADETSEPNLCAYEAYKGPTEERTVSPVDATNRKKSVKEQSHAIASRIE